MLVNRNEVLLLKSQVEDGANKYESLLKENGFTVSHVQVLDFEFINFSVLKERLNTPDLYKGIIFTSPRAVSATAQCLENMQLDEKWAHKENFVVGETTFELAKKELGIICQGKESGNANNLADLIIKGTKKCTFLFPCGNLKKETLEQRLSDHDIKLDAVTVYETKKYRNLENDFYRLTHNLEKLPEYIVYFSPSGVKFTNDILRKCAEYFNEIKLIALGPSTTEALKNENFPVYSFALKPTEFELLNAIKKNNFQ